MKHYTPPIRSERDAADIGNRGTKDPHSVAFAWQTINWIKGRFHSLSLSEKHWTDALAEAEEYKIYLKVPPEKPYGSLDAMLKAEIGVDLDTSITVVKTRMQAAAQQTKKKDTPVTQGERTDLHHSSKLPQTERAVQNGVGRHTQQRLDWLARHAPALCDAVKAGTLSVHRACINAGHIAERTPLDQLKRAWNKASPAEQQAFRAFIHPNEGCQHEPTPQRRLPP